nr:MAG TPA: hypothetical protein [Caudoviricetes sp.]
MPCVLIKIIYLYCTNIISFGRTKVKCFFKIFLFVLHILQQKSLAV